MNSTERKEIGAEGTIKKIGTQAREMWKLSFDKKSKRKKWNYRAVLNFVQTENSKDMYYTTIFEVDEKAYKAIMIREMGKRNADKWNQNKPNEIEADSYIPFPLKSRFGDTVVFIIQKKRTLTPTRWNTKYVRTVREGIEEGYKDMAMEKATNNNALTRAIKESKSGK